MSGYAKDWVSGPLQRTIHIGPFMLCLYWASDKDPVTWVDFELFEITGMIDGQLTFAHDDAAADPTSLVGADRDRIREVGWMYAVSGKRTC